MTAPVLSVEQVVAGYSGQAVLHRVDLAVRGGEIVTLLGANGAGKSTLLKTVMGTVPVIAGRISVNGRRIERWVAHRRVAAGIGFSPEGRRIFANLTVAENLIVGAAVLRSSCRAACLDGAADLFPILGRRMGQKAGTLSGGEQQMLAIARAMTTRPKLLLVEEPSQGLAPVLVDHVYATLRRIADEAGVAVLVAEQFQQARDENCDRVLVIDKGTVLDDADLARPIAFAAGENQ